MKRIKRRDGTEAVVADDYIIADGESFTIPLAMMDSKPRMVCDSRGNPAGQRPGFLYADSDIDVAHAVLETAYRMYRDDIEQRWRSDRWSKPSGSLPTVSKSNQPQSFDSPQAAVDAAYAQYRHDIEARWRR